MPRKTPGVRIATGNMYQTQLLRISKRRCGSKNHLENVGLRAKPQSGLLRANPEIENAAGGTFIRGEIPG